MHKRHLFFLSGSLFYFFTIHIHIIQHQVLTIFKDTALLGILNIHITHHNTGNRRFGQAHHHNGGIHITDRHTRNIDVTKFRSSVTLRFGRHLAIFQIENNSFFLDITHHNIAHTNILHNASAATSGFRRIPRSVPSKTQLLMVTFFTPPLISLPITTPPCPLNMVQLVMVIFSQGTPSLRACKSRPDLMVMQSSPTEMWQSLMCTFLQDSGLMPSVLGEGTLWMVMPLMVTLSQKFRIYSPEGRVDNLHALYPYILTTDGMYERRTEKSDGPVCHASLHWFQRKGLSGRFPSRTWAGTC